MNISKLDYTFQKFDQENIEILLTTLKLNIDNYFFAMFKPSILNRTLIGNIADLFNRNCIICFSETEMNLIMLSRLDNKKVTEIIKINRNEINNIKLSNILISYMLRIKLNESTLKFQVFKKYGKFTKTAFAIDLFKKLYQ